MYIYIIYIYYIYIILYKLLDHFAVFHLTYKENIKKTREAVTPRLDTVKQCASKDYIERLQGQCKE